MFWPPDQPPFLAMSLAAIDQERGRDQAPGTLTMKTKYLTQREQHILDNMKSEQPTTPKPDQVQAKARRDFIGVLARGFVKEAV